MNAASGPKRTGERYVATRRALDREERFDG